MVVDLQSEAWSSLLEGMIIDFEISTLNPSVDLRYCGLP